MITNPIITGFSPDPSILRVNDDYYIANSTFEWFPGVRLYHSRDLANWKEIKPPLRRRSQLNMAGDPNSGGIWAPDISYRDGIFYLLYTDVKSKIGLWYNTPNYVVWTDDINGEWSEPVYLNSTGFDPSFFHDTDGRTWLVNMRNGFRGILIQEFDVEAKSLVGPVRNIYTGTTAGYTEGPHIYRRGDYYYLMAAEGGTGFGHQITIARAISLFGPYETMPNNPLLTSNNNATLALQKAGHGDLVETKAGEWFMPFLCSRPVPGHMKCVLGRETGLVKIMWTDDNWPALAKGGNYPELTVTEPEGLTADTASHMDAKHAFFDGFDSATLDFGWKSLRIPAEENITLTERPGFLGITGRESIFSLHRVSLLARKQEAFNMRIETAMDFNPDLPEHFAGLAYIYDNAHFYLFGKTRADSGETILVLYGCDAQKTTKLFETKLFETNHSGTTTDGAKKSTSGTIRLALRTDSRKAVFFLGERRRSVAGRKPRMRRVYPFRRIRSRLYGRPFRALLP